MPSNGVRSIRIALAQINPTVGDLKGNVCQIKSMIQEGRRAGADWVLFPELAVCGYPPEDLLFKPAFLRDSEKALQTIAKSVRGIFVVVGCLDWDSKGGLYNAAAILHAGRVQARYRKMRLPNTGVFDEKRYFQSGIEPMLCETGSEPIRLGISICEDIWVGLKDSPCQAQVKEGASLLMNISASPYHAGKRSERERLISRLAKQCHTPVVYLNLVGGQDELVFDGGSLAAGPTGRIIFRAPQFEAGLFLVDVPLPKRVKLSRDSQEVCQHISLPKPLVRRRCKATPSRAPSDPTLEVFKALCLGTRDYVEKNQFSQVVLGLSGGIDSALTLAIATAALGPERVTAVSMPSRYSSLETRSDARVLSQRLGVHFLELPIESIFGSALRSLDPVFQGQESGLAQENLQARIRGLLLMALSNQFGWLVLATGNKSELSTGYCTLYGDLVGGFAVIKDLSKGQVYRLSRYANRYFKRSIIPESILRRPPTAELKPNQKDSDSLPAYSRLDSVLRAYIEEEASVEQMQKKLKFSSSEIKQIVQRIDQNEYKRRQAPLGIKITPRAFGRDHRMPVTNRFSRG